MNLRHVSPGYRLAGIGVLATLAFAGVEGNRAHARGTPAHVAHEGAHDTNKGTAHEAHKGGRHGQMGMPSVDDHVKHLTKELNLTEDQQAKVKSLLEEQQKQMAALRQDSTLSPEDRRAKFQEIHQKTSQEIREALNKDQQ